MKHRIAFILPMVLVSMVCPMRAVADDAQPATQPATQPTCVRYDQTTKPGMAEPAAYICTVADGRRRRTEDRDSQSEGFTIQITNGREDPEAELLLFPHKKLALYHLIDLDRATLY